MRKISINKYLFVTRWLLLVGLLSAMFFSHGEGISLLPFSSSKNDNGSFTDSAANKLDSYVFSVHNSHNQRNSAVSKSAKNLKNSLLSPGLTIFRSRETILSNFTSLKKNFFEAKLYASSGISSPPSDRAPPLV